MMFRLPKWLGGKVQPSKDILEGIRFTVGIENGKVIIDFGTPVHWLGITPPDAIKFAELIIEKARKVQKDQSPIIVPGRN